MPDAEAPLMLSVSGARGIINRSMTPNVAAHFAAAFADWVIEKVHLPGPLICIGRDPRPSGTALMEAAAGSLQARGCRVMILDIAATPTVSAMMTEHEADGGLVITASHNPQEWNGLKCMGPGGVAPGADDAHDIIRRFKDQAVSDMPPGPTSPVEVENCGAQLHVNQIVAHINPIPAQDAAFRVMLDSVNGAGCEGGRLVLESFGCDLIHLNGDPTGMFSHPPEPIREHLAELVTRIRKKPGLVDCGFAQDPDADRLVVIDEKGRFIGEEYTLVLAARYALGTGRRGIMATNLSTSRMIDDLAAVYEGVTVVRTPVGEANVAAAMQASDAVVIGGEGNGGVIVPAVCWARDSLSAMAMILALMAETGCPLSELVDGMPCYAMQKKKFSASALDLTTMFHHLRAEFSGETIDSQDGIRIDFADGWVHVRASNTEPVVRLIGEAGGTQRCDELMLQVAGIAGLD